MFKKDSDEEEGAVAEVKGFFKAFKENKYAYQSEINAIKDILPSFYSAIEIGVGSGKFALPFKIKLGVEPSAEMKKIAENRGITVLDGVAEDLPLENERLDLALMVTTLCFLDDAKKAFSEVYRILKPGGYFVNGFIDKNSRIGKLYQKHKDRSILLVGKRDTYFYLGWSRQ